MSLTLRPYVTALQASKDDNRKAMAAAYAGEAAAQVDLQIAQLRLDIAAREATVASLSGAYPFSATTLVSALDGLGVAQRKLTQLTEIRAQLFPAAPAAPANAG